MLYLIRYSRSPFCVLGQPSYQNALTLGFHLGLSEEEMNNDMTQVERHIFRMAQPVNDAVL
jgi:hypothetical protein